MQQLHSWLVIVGGFALLGGAIDFFIGKKGQNVRLAAKLLGWKAVVYDGHNEQLKDLAAVNAAVDAKSSAIILVLIDPSTIGAAVQRALNAHIPVATVGVPVFLHGKRVRAAQWDSIPSRSARDGRTNSPAGNASASASRVP